MILKVEIHWISGALPPGTPPGLCPGPGVSFKPPRSPSCNFMSTVWAKVFGLCMKTQFDTKNGSSYKCLERTLNWLSIGLSSFQRKLQVRFKGYVSKIFGSLFFKSEWEHFSNYGKIFSFHRKSSFHSKENEIVEF